MEDMIINKVTPGLKCMVLFLFIFTAKVLTSKPQDYQDETDLKNSLNHIKPLQYVRTFTKYHHRRTTELNSLQEHYWPVTPNIQKKIVKRSVETLNSNEYVSNSENVPNLNQFPSENGVDIEKKDNHKTEVRKYKVKAAIRVTDAPTTPGPKISCLYKINSVAMSMTPSYEEDNVDDISNIAVENDSFDVPGNISLTTLPNGETVQAELCTDSRASCYTLWNKDNVGNITVLGQGCWRSSQKQCNKCTRVTAKLPATKFCCCSGSFCNVDFTSLQEEVIIPKAELTTYTVHQTTNYSNLIAAAILSLVAILVLAVVIKKIYCKNVNTDKDDISNKMDVEKNGDNPDALATGLLCVDNLTLLEHIGQGKFGSVWRGSLGNAPVAVKLYSSQTTWQRESAIYNTPLQHPHLLKYYGSDSRPSISERGCRSLLIVLELCRTRLSARLTSATLTLVELASLAHQLASALHYLHTPGPGKPCIVHRDLNSNNILISMSGEAKLADLGLSQPLQARKDGNAPSRITEAGTIRYLAPEALEGALDLSGARAALCAVDVYALGLVLWEMLWRCPAAHLGPTPPYSPPFHHHGATTNPTISTMQRLVCRMKARPPLPSAGGPAVRVLADTCDQCWDHDAEARLTAVCVEERMAELKQLLQTQGPVIHENNLNEPHAHFESEKNSNCQVLSACEVTTPLLYPHPHIGRNACIERNTNTQPQPVQLIHKSLKDITVSSESSIKEQNIEDNCMSVARISRSRIPTLQDSENSDRINEIRSYQRPLDYVQNDVSASDDRALKQTNLLQDIKVDKPKWGIRMFFDRKLSKVSKPLQTEVKLIQENQNMVRNGKTKTSIVNAKNLNFDRPANLVLDHTSTYDFEIPCTLSPPNRTLSPTMMLESEINRQENRIFGFKEIPQTANETQKVPNQIFAVIVPKAMPTNLIEMRNKNSKGSSESINKSSIRNSMSSQSMIKSGHSESEDSAIKQKYCSSKIATNSCTSGRSSRASINLELTHLDNNKSQTYSHDSPFDLNSDCSSSEDEHLMLLSENGGSKITMQTIPKLDTDKVKFQNEVLKESSHAKPVVFNKYHNKYTNFDNEFSDPNDKENLLNGYSGDNPVYLAALNGEIDASELKCVQADTSAERSPKSPKPSLRNLAIKRQHSLEQVSELFTSSSDVHLLNPAGRVKTPGDLPVAVRKARRDRALQKGRASESNRLSLYDDRMMFGNSL